MFRRVGGAARNACDNGCGHPLPHEHASSTAPGDSTAPHDEALYPSRDETMRTIAKMRASTTWKELSMAPNDSTSLARGPTAGPWQQPTVLSRLTAPCKVTPLHDSPSAAVSGAQRSRAARATYPRTACWSTGNRLSSRPDMPIASTCRPPVP
jgi:hypothetical protein